ncbi:gamma-glutamyltransferase, partial [Mycobacterium tuberculosis]|nr:gamma-glutamyltransferase [Mycobacterium tuberculosis]
RYDIVSSPPPSSGGVIICEILNVLGGYPLSYLGYGCAETVHAMVEAMRYAYVDRNSALGDPDFVNNPVSKLLDKAYAKEI